MPSKKKREDLPLFLSPEQAAKISGLGVNRIRQLMEDGQLEYLPVGNRRLTTVQALLDYYKRAKVPAWRANHRPPLKEIGGIMYGCYRTNREK